MSIRNGLLTLGDILISLLVIFPLSILHWRGTWELQDIYFKPQDPVNTVWISFAIGGNVCVLELLLQPLLIEKLDPSRRCLYFAVSRLHLYIHGWAVMCYWRGLWDLCDLYLTEHWVNAVVMYCICQFIMVVTKTVRTAVGVPAALSLDISDSLLEPDLVYKTPHSQICTFVFDCLFTQFVVVTSSICIWRSIWNILDAFIFPQRHFRSDVVSLIAGFSVTTVILFSYWPLSVASHILDRRPALKLLFEDFIFLVLTWSNLLLWRGSWNLCIQLFLPPDGVAGPAVGAWVSHFLGTVGLMTLQAFNTVGLHGIERDGSYSGGSGVFAITYLREMMPASCLIAWYGHRRDKVSDMVVENGDIDQSTADGTQLINTVNNSDLSSDDELFGLLDASSTAGRKVTNGSYSVSGNTSHGGIQQYVGGNMSGRLSGVSINHSTVIR